MGSAAPQQPLLLPFPSLPQAPELSVTVWPPALWHGSAPAASPGSSEPFPLGTLIAMEGVCPPHTGSEGPTAPWRQCGEEASHRMPSERCSMPPCPAPPRAVGRCPLASDWRLHLLVANPLRCVKLAGCLHLQFRS